MTTFACLLLAATFTRVTERVMTVDPALVQSVYDNRVVQLIYETPLAIDYTARPYRMIPCFCELPDVSADGLTYVFRVRSANGDRPLDANGDRPLEAKDMVRSLERLRDPDLVSPNAWILQDVDTIRAVNAGAVEIRLKKPVRYFPWLMTMGATGIRGTDGRGTGPYFLAHWRKNHEMVFKRRKGRQNVGLTTPTPTSTPTPTPTPTHFDTIRYLVVDDMSTQWLMFLKGELDFIGEVSRDNWDSILGADGRLDPALEKKGMRLHLMPSLEVMYLGINMRDPVLGPNRKLRQALNAAFDFPEWKRFYHDKIAKCDGPVPPGLAGRLEEPFAYAFNLPLARRLMAEAGYADGIDPKTGRRLVLTLAIGRANQESREAGELMAAFYEKIGIRLDLDFMTWDAFLKAVSEGRAQLFRVAWVADYPDAQNYLQLFYGPNKAPGINRASYVNADYDAAYERGDYETAQRIVREDCPWIFQHYNMTQVLVGPRVGNYVPSDFPYGNEQYYEPRETNAK